MQVKILINDKPYKTVPIEGTKYNPAQFQAMIDADKDAGLLNNFNIDKKMSIRYELVK